MLLLLMIAGCIEAQTMSREDEASVKNYVFDKLVKENFVKLNRVTREGDLASCELEFQNTFRDNRARGGSPVFLTGSFSAMYNKGKYPGFSLKVNASDMDIATQKWINIVPTYLNVIAGKSDFSNYKIIDFDCESGGKCLGYEDRSLALNLAVISAIPFDAEIVLSLSKGGMDYSFKLSNLMPAEVAKRTLNKFIECNLEILEKVTKDLEAISK
jgi:hypothetical protein